MNVRHLVAAAIAGMALSACWDSGSSNPVIPPVSTQVPDSALASSTAWTAYVASLPPSETDEPIGVNNVMTPPSSETDDPAPVN
jgi:hypothetical protein